MKNQTMTQLLNRTIAGLALAVAAPNAFAADLPIYECASDHLAEESVSKNPDHVRSLKLQIIQTDKIVAGRPRVFLQGEFVDANGENGIFILNAIGIPEFLGVNMKHAYFTGTFTSTDGQYPEQFKLVSHFSKLGHERANFSINNRSSGVGDNIVLKDVSVRCTVPNESIYIYL